MSWHERINNKIYFSVTVLNLAIAVLFGMPDISATFWLFVVVFCSIGNHYFMIRALNALISSRLDGGAAPGKNKLFLSVMGKTLFLILGFICLILYAREYVLQGLSLYIFQLIILALSIKNIEKFFKKGSL